MPPRAAVCHEVSILSMSLSTAVQMFGDVGTRFRASTGIFNSIFPGALQQSGLSPAPGPDRASSSRAPLSRSQEAVPSTQSVRNELNRFLASVERRALRIAEIGTGSRDDALDVVQDAMLQLANSYSDKPPTEWPPLFHRILENKICDWQRRQTVRRRLFGWATSHQPEEDEGDPLAEMPDLTLPAAVDQLKQAEAMKVLRTAIAELPKRQRQAFVLRIWEGLSVEETATVMACSDGSVKTHLSRALSALRGKLEDVWA